MRTPVLAGVIGAILLLPATQASPAEPKAGSHVAPAAKPAFREVTWDDLVPKDWDPLKQFKGVNLGMLNDGDPRATEMLKRMRETWDNAPSNAAMDGQSVRIPGYIVPLDDSKAGLKEFLLVPYFGACIHTPPPPSNQIIHVTSAKPIKGVRSMDPLWVSGTLHTAISDTVMGTSGYRMELDEYAPYREGK